MCPESNLAVPADIPLGSVPGSDGARVVLLLPDRADEAFDRLAQRFAAAPVPVMVAAEGQVIDL